MMSIASRRCVVSDTTDINPSTDIPLQRIEPDARYDIEVATGGKLIALRGDCFKDAAEWLQSIGAGGFTSIHPSDPLMSSALDVLESRAKNVYGANSVTVKFNLSEPPRK